MRFRVPRPNIEAVQKSQLMSPTYAGRPRARYGVFTPPERHRHELAEPAWAAAVRAQTEAERTLGEMFLSPKCASAPPETVKRERSRLAGW
jgi:hypothetical protein